MIRDQNAEEVITLINRFINYGKSKSEKVNNKSFSNIKSKRKKVYADTSTGGWY